MSHYFLVHVTNCFTVSVSKKAPALNYCQCLLSSPNTWRHWHKMVERLKDIKILKRWMMLKPNFVKLVTLYVCRWLDSNWTRTKSVKWFGNIDWSMRKSNSREIIIKQNRLKNTAQLVGFQLYSYLLVRILFLRLMRLKIWINKNKKNLSTTDAETLYVLYMNTTPGDRS